MGRVREKSGPGKKDSGPVRPGEEQKEGVPSAVDDGERVRLSTVSLALIAAVVVVGGWWWLWLRW